MENDKFIVSCNINSPLDITFAHGHFCFFIVTGIHDKVIFVPDLVNLFKNTIVIVAIMNTPFYFTSRLFTFRNGKC